MKTEGVRVGDCSQCRETAQSMAQSTHLGNPMEAAPADKNNRESSGVTRYEENKGRGATGRNERDLHLEEKAKQN